MPTEAIISNMNPISHRIQMLQNAAFPQPPVKQLSTKSKSLTNPNNRPTKKQVQNKLTTNTQCLVEDRKSVDQPNATSHIKLSHMFKDVPNYTEVGKKYDAVHMDHFIMMQNARAAKKKFAEVQELARQRLAIEN